MRDISEGGDGFTKVSNWVFLHIWNPDLNATRVLFLEQN